MQLIQYKTSKFKKGPPPIIADEIIISISIIKKLVDAGQLSLLGIPRSSWFLTIHHLHGGERG